MDLRVATTVARHAVSRKYLPVMLHKVVERVAEQRRAGETASAREWYAERAENAGSARSAVDPNLWREAERFDQQAQARLAALGLDLGGGGHYPLAYFLVRLTRPRTCVETGVAAGWTSSAILSALEHNDLGCLWSSDFPYFRLDQPQEHIGYLVDEPLRRRWDLLIDGDRRNLRRSCAR